MTIKKFQGKTKEEAIEKAKAELGENAVVMNIKEIKPKGVFQSLKKSTYEVTAAMEEKENYVDSGLALKNAQKMHETINMTADEPIKIPLVKEEPMDQAKAEQSAIEFLKRNAELLKNESSQKTTDDSERTERIEEKLENLQSILEKQYSENQEKAK